MLLSTSTVEPSEDIIDDEDFASLRAPLDRYKRNRLSVTDLSGQLWCERKVLYHLETGTRDRATISMIRGIARHLELELADHEVETLEVTTREDDLGIRMLNTVTGITSILPQQRKVREVWIGTIVPELDGVLRGIIDELELLPDGDLVLKDTKTREREDQPSAAQKKTSAIQLQTYMWLLQLMRPAHCARYKKQFFATYSVDAMSPFTAAPLTPYTNLDQLYDKFCAAVASLPPAKPYALIEYEYGGQIFAIDQVGYNENVVRFSLSHLFGFWNGSRGTVDCVKYEERWKCKRCMFVDRCTATRLSEGERIAAIQDLQDIEALADALDDLE